MGMYTGLRMRGQLKKHAIPLIKNLYKLYQDSKSLNISTWHLLQDKHASSFDFKEFLKLKRCDFIPFGGIEIFQWKEDDFSWKTYLSDSGYWVFQCSLKNYDNEIQCFLETVAPQLFETCDHCEELYCENELSALYALENNKFVIKREQVKEFCHHFNYFGIPAHDQYSCSKRLNGYQSKWMEFCWEQELRQK